MKDYIQLYRKNIQRTSWRLRYYYRSRKKRETSYTEELLKKRQIVEIEDTLSRLAVDEWISTLSTEKGKFIIRQLIYADQTEQEIAQVMGISQQGVNKWKRRMLDQMKQQMQTIRD